jgi:hypothetical protein
LQGPAKPNPLLSLFPIFSDQNAPSHPYMTNFIGVQNIIEAVKSSSNNNNNNNNNNVQRIVRLSGKGEQPFSPISILLNMLGYLAKGWNYEGEQYLRQSGIDYTIIRPGLLKHPIEFKEPTKARALMDNGRNMKVSTVTFDQIAELCTQCIQYDNAKKSTLTVMNVEENMGQETYDGLLLQQVQPDSREFEHSLIQQHRMGARLGFTVLAVFLGGVYIGLTNMIGYLFHLGKTLF